MKDIATGDPVAANRASELNRWSNNLLGYGSIGSAGLLGGLTAFGDPMGLSTPVSAVGGTAIGLGLLGKKGAGAMRDAVAEKGTERVNTLIRNIVTGSSDKPGALSVPREALARVLAEEQLKRGVGRYSSNWYDKE